MSKYPLYVGSPCEFSLDHDGLEKLFAGLGWHAERPVVAFRHLPGDRFGAFEAPLHISIDPGITAKREEVLNGTMTRRESAAWTLAHKVGHFFWFHYGRGLKRFWARRYDAVYSWERLRSVLHGWAFAAVCYVFFLHNRFTLGPTGHIMLFGALPAALVASMALLMLPRVMAERDAKRFARQFMAEKGELILSCIRAEQGIGSVE